jgi:hypothetical protein
MLRRHTVSPSAVSLVPERGVPTRLAARRHVLVGLLVALVSVSCASLGRKPSPPPPPPPPGQPLTPEATLAPDDEPLPVNPVAEPIVVAAWAEPKELPEGGGQVQILVRVQKRGGRRFPDVEVRLKSSTGSLFSTGRVLVTDASGMTRDRLTTKKTAVITLNAGGTVYRFRVPVGEARP